LDPLPDNEGESGMIELVRSKLQDAESRKVFDILVEFQRTGDYAPFQEIISNPLLRKSGLDAKVAQLRELRKNGIKIIQWGLGSFGLLLLRLLLRHYHLTPDYICDRKVSEAVDTDFLEHIKIAQKHGIPVITPGEMFASHKEAAIVIAPTQYNDEMADALRGNGFNDNRIFQQLTEKLQRDGDYFVRDFLFPANDEVYIDCGAFDLGTVKNFIAFTNGAYKKIYAFEPDPESFKRCRALAESGRIQRLYLLNQACWSENGFVSFDVTNGMGSKISSNGEHYVETVTIDDVVDGDRVTFIKMDIEGAELEALKGATKTIRRCRPRMAICVYHKPDDIVTLPTFVLSVVPDYKLYLRHDFYLMSGTVMYFV
jgi:FkbM family methyltransferase